MTEQRTGRAAAQPSELSNPPADTGQTASGQLLLDVGGSVWMPTVYIDGRQVPVKYGLNYFTLTAGMHEVRFRRWASPIVGRNTIISANVPPKGAIGFYYRPPKLRHMLPVHGRMPIKPVFDEAGALIGTTLDTEAGARADRKAWLIVLLIWVPLLLAAIAAVASAARGS